VTAALDGQPRTLGKYELLHELARGGMAVLYLAKETGIEGFEKVVVVKCMLPELARHREYVDMFLDEARIAAALEHPNLPHVYELGRAGETLFFAMEYLHGTDVRRLVQTVAARRRELPLEHAISIVLGLSAGLHYAHEKQLVHRDVSPKNVFVTYDGGVKLLDFGIAHARNKRSETSAGAVKGTVQYLAPEQVRATDVDGRTDVFSASILLWELTTGKRLYTGTDYEIMNRIVDHDAPRPSTIASEYPAALEAIVMKGLAREPAKRFASAAELHLALEELARDLRLATSTLGLARFMREIYVEDVAAYEQAKECGKLATLVESRSARAHVEPARDPAAIEASPLHKPTRRLEPRPTRRARWSVLVVLAVLVLIASLGGFALYARQPGDRPPPAAPSATGSLAGPAEPADSTAAAPAAVSVPPREPPSTPPASVKPLRVDSPPVTRRHKPRPDPKPVSKPDPGPSAKPGPTPLTDSDLDAVLPPRR